MNLGKDYPVMLGNYIKQARKKKQLKQHQVAKVIDCSIQFYGRIENGYVTPPSKSFANLISYLDLNQGVVERIVKLSAMSYVQELFEKAESIKRKSNRKAI